MSEKRESGKKSVTVMGQKYNSRSEAARALLGMKNEKTGKPFTCSEVAELTHMSAQTVYTQTKEGKAKVASRRAGYRALSLAKTGKYTAQTISERCGIERSALNKVLGEANITCPSATDLKQREKEAADKKEAAKAEKQKQREEEKAKRKAEKQKEKEAVPAAAEKNTAAGTPPKLGGTKKGSRKKK